jgi:hypothetical protein
MIGQHDYGDLILSVIGSEYEGCFEIAIWRHDGDGKRRDGFMPIRREPDGWQDDVLILQERGVQSVMDAMPQGFDAAQAAIYVAVEEMSR